MENKIEEKKPVVDKYTDYLYGVLKDNNAYDGDYDKFYNEFYQPGIKGYTYRKDLYDTMTSHGIDLGASYEDFANWIGLHAIDPQTQQTLMGADSISKDMKPIEVAPTTKPEAKKEEESLSNDELVNGSQASTDTLQDFNPNVRRMRNAGTDYHTKAAEEISNSAYSNSYEPKSLGELANQAAKDQKNKAYQVTGGETYTHLNQTARYIPIRSLPKDADLDSIFEAARTFENQLFGGAKEYTFAPLGGDIQEKYEKWKALNLNSGSKYTQETASMSPNAVYLQAIHLKASGKERPAWISELRWNEALKYNVEEINKIAAELEQEDRQRRLKRSGGAYPNDVSLKGMYHANYTSSMAGDIYNIGTNKTIFVLFQDGRIRPLQAPDPSVLRGGEEEQREIFRRQYEKMTFGEEGKDYTDAYDKNRVVGNFIQNGEVCHIIYAPYMIEQRRWNDAQELINLDQNARKVGGILMDPKDRLLIMPVVVKDGESEEDAIAKAKVGWDKEISQKFPYKETFLQQQIAQAKEALEKEKKRLKQLGDHDVVKRSYMGPLNPHYVDDIVAVRNKDVRERSDEVALARGNIDKYETAIKKYTQALEALRTGGQVGFWGGFLEGISDIGNWTFGLSNLRENLVAAKANEGKMGREARERLWLARSLNQESMSAFHKYVEGRFYGVGFGTGYSTAFTTQAVLTYGAGNIAARGIIRTGTRMAAKYGTNWLFDTTIRSFSRLAAINAAGVIDSSFQWSRIVSDAAIEKMGLMNYTFDENQQIVVKGTLQEKSWGKALLHSGASMLVENVSERIGTYVLNPIEKAFGLGKLNLRSFGEALPYSKTIHMIQSGAFAKAMSKVYGTFERGGYDGFVNEVLEEYIANPMTATFDENYTFADIFDSRQNLDTALSVWASSIFMLGLSTTASSVKYYRTLRSVNRAYDEADANARRLFGNENWDKIQKTILNLEGGQLVDAMYAGVCQNESLSDEQKKAFLNYVRAQKAQAVFNNAVSEKYAFSLTGEELNEMNAMTIHAYAEGRSMQTPQEYAQAQQAFADTREMAMSSLGVTDDIDAYLDTLGDTPAEQLKNGVEAAKENGLDEKAANAALSAYLNAREQQKGALDAITSDESIRRQHADNVIRQITFENEADSEGGSGRIILVNVKGKEKPVFLIRGRYENGSIAGETVVISDGNGGIQMIPASDVEGINSESDAKAERQLMYDKIEASNKEQQRLINLNMDTPLAGQGGILMDEEGHRRQVSIKLVYNDEQGNPASVLVIDQENNDYLLPIDVFREQRGRGRKFEAIEPYLDETDEEYHAAEGPMNEEYKLANEEQEDAQEDDTQEAAEDAAPQPSTDDIVQPSTDDILQPAKPEVKYDYHVKMKDGSGNSVSGRVINLSADGVEIEFDAPYNGKMVDRISIADFDNGVSEIADENGNVLWNDAEAVGDTQEATEDVAPQPSTDDTPTQTEQQETHKPTALERIPRNEKGEPIFEQAENPEVAWDALVEFSGGDVATAKEIADAMAEEKRKALEKARKLKLKGKTPTEILASKQANAAELAKAESEYNHWQRMANVEQNRQNAIRAQQEAEARQRAAERGGGTESKSGQGEVKKTKPSFLDAVKALYTKGKEFASKLYQMTFFDVAETPAFMKQLGLTGDRFTIRYGVIARHLGKDGRHDLPESVWEQLPKAIQDPFAITEYYTDEDKKEQKGYRLYTALKLSDGSFVVVSAEVKNAGRDIEVNAINTVFGRDALSEVHDKLIYQSPTITPEQQALLNGNNPHQYTAGREVSGDKVTETSATEQGNEEKSVGGEGETSLSAKIDAASVEVNTEPTEAQKEAGNYKKGHVQVGTFDITIEQPQGSVRKGTDANGKQWESKMHNTYGYIRGTEGVDGDHIDVFLSNDIDGWNGRKVFVVDQYNPDGSFDEHKVMLGFNDMEEAKSDYLANYEKGWENGRRIDVTAVNLEDFEKWIASSKRKTKPFSEYKSVKSANENNVSDSEKKSSENEVEESKQYGKYQEEFDNFVSDIENGRGIPNLKSIKNRIRDTKRRLTILRNGAATSIQSDEDLKRFEAAEKDLTDLLHAYEAMRDYTEAKIREAEAAAQRKPWSEKNAQERMDEASKNPLTEEEILNAPTDEVNKANALDYLNGNHGLIQSISYLKVYEDVRNPNGGAASDSSTTDKTQLAGGSNSASKERDAGGNLGGTVGRVDNGGSTENVSEQSDGGKSGEGSTRDNTGEGSNTGIPTEEQPMGRRDTNGGKSRRGSTSGRTRSNGGRSGRGKSGNPATENGTRGIASESVKEESADDFLNKALDEFKDVLDDFIKAGRGELSISLVGLNSKQMEMLPRLIQVGAKVGYAYIRKGVHGFTEWAKHVKEAIGKYLRDANLSDDEIDAFIKEMWKSKIPFDGQIHTLEEWASIYGKEKLRNKVRLTIEEKREAQRQAESIPVKEGDIDNIRETLPFLLPQQQEDVLKAETQFFDETHQDREHANGKGYMFTNGTGTGKTYTGLGIVKRFVKMGKKRILILTPSQPKVRDWIKDGENLGLEIRSLDDWAKEHGTTATTEAGKGTIITTYANFRQNEELLNGVFDLIVYDESHRLMENKQATNTIGTEQHHMIANRDAVFAANRLRKINPVYQERDKVHEEFKAKREQLVSKGLIPYSPDVFHWHEEDTERFPELAQLHNRFQELTETINNEVDPQIEEQAKKDAAHTKVVFLSATPFNTRENIDYAQGYIFSYPDKEQARGYSVASPMTIFFEDHFGAAYKWRYGRLEHSERNAEAIAQQERDFSDWLQHTLCTMSGRIIDSEYDYSRDFPVVTVEHAEEINNAAEEILRDKYFSAAYHKVFGNYNYAGALFETLKVATLIPRIKQHIEAGRKVVIFHRRVESKKLITPPFATMLAVCRNILAEMKEQNKPAEDIDAARHRLEELKEKWRGLLYWESMLDYSMPREQIAKAFGQDNVLYFSGQESTKVKNQAVDSFNNDESGKNIIVIQEASGKEGISLHDTTGKHQRVLITLALPQSPITALQIEGRIYRIGNRSNAIFEYPLLGLNSEIILFGQKFNGQIGTTENLALGSQARNLRESFARSVEESGKDVPIEEQGFGGKEADAAEREETAPFDRAVLDYYGNQKLKGKRDNREGIDYYPTPEPLGFKMVEWGMLNDGETALEPSAGHGAIARYVPSSNPLTAIEPSQNLFAKLQLKAGGSGRKFVNTIFEDYNLVNKHDVIFMNPPFGTGGRLAVDHVAKAFTHLTEGGRIVAIIPRGSTDKKFDKWIGEQENAVVTGQINLPDITFQQAGTSVMARVVVIDKVTNQSLRSEAQSKYRSIDLSQNKYDKIEDFFEDIRDIQMPIRTIDKKARMLKRAAPALREIKELKGVVDVQAQESGISIRTKGSASGLYLNLESFNDLEVQRNLIVMYDRYARAAEWAERRNDEKAIEIYKSYKDLICRMLGKTEEEISADIARMKMGAEQPHEKQATPANIAPKTAESQSSEQNESAAESSPYHYELKHHTKTGAEMYMAMPNKKGGLSSEEYSSVLAKAKKHGGYWNRFMSGFAFPSEKNAKDFLAEMGNTEPQTNERYQRGVEGVKPSKAEVALRDAVVDLMRKSGLEVLDSTEGQQVLDEANGRGAVRTHAMILSLTKAANTIRGWIIGNKRGKSFTIELPTATQHMVRRVMGRDFDSHNITANGVAHAQKNHGVGGQKLNENSIPLTKVDMELIPYIMTAPDYVRRGSDDVSGRVSVRFYKELSNGYVVVAEKEYKNSPDDMETITMWAEKSDKATNAQRIAAPDTHVQNAILDIDVAKIRKDAENAIAKDRNIREQRVYHGSGVRFFRTSNGEAYGFTVGGKIYIDPSIATAETPIHEYAHLWATAMREANPTEWKNIVGLMKGTSVWAEVQKLYPELKNDDDIADEVLATFSGRRGAARLRAEQQRILQGNGSVFEKASAVGALSRVKQALSKFWKGVADFLGIHYTSAEEVADRVMKDLLEGVDPRKMGGRTTVSDAADTEVMRRKTGVGDTKFSDVKREQKSQVATTIADMKQRVTELFEKAKTGEFVGKPASIGRLSVDGKAYLEKLSGLKFKEFVDFVLNPSDLNHIRSDHYGENEKDKGKNAPLTDEDIQNMVDVLNQPDGILYGVDKKDGRKLFFFLKDAGNGLYNLTEVCSTKKGNLTAKSFFKSKKKGISQRVMEIKASLLPTSVTYSGEFLSSDAKIPTLFEINEGSSKNVADDGLLFRDGDMGLEETSTEMKVDATQAAQKAAENLNLGDSIVVHENAEGLEGREATAKGWYDTRTGEIHVVLSNNADAADVTQTILHEAVAHHGLRELLGHNVMNAFLDSVFAAASQEVKNAINELRRGNGWDLRTATEEYMAGLAERKDFERMTEEERGLFATIRRLFNRALEFLGLKNHELSDRELAYILWCSYQNLKTGKKGRYVAEAERIAMRYKLKAGKSAMTDTQKRENAVLLRGKLDNLQEINARETYERLVTSGAHLERTAWVDMLSPLQDLQHAIEKNGGFRLEDFENPYNAYISMSSRNYAQMDIYKRTLYSDMIEAIHAFGSETGRSYEEIKMYVMAKHGMERQQYMAGKAAKEAYDKYKDKHPFGKKTLDDFIDKFQEKSFAGLTGLFFTNSVSDAMYEAQRYVDEVEADAGSLTDSLWESIRSATKSSLQRVYEAGMLSKETYDYVSSMYQYYIPLRGFDETTSSEVYEYFGDKTINSGTGSFMKKAKGRRSVADDPFAIIGNMAEMAIVQSNRNLMKQQLLNLALNHPSDLISVSDLYVKFDEDYDNGDGTRGAWVPVAVPDTSGMTTEEANQVMLDFQDDMEEKIKSDSDTYALAHQKPHIPYRVLGRNINEHQVLVKRGGKTYILTINGNPRAAQAVNGLLNPDATENPGAIALKTMTHWIAQMATARNVEFAISNAMRDLEFSTTLIPKEGTEYYNRYIKNYLTCVKNVGRLVNRLNSNRLDMNNPLDKAFYDFIYNGGETGYTFMRGVERYKGEIAKALSELRSKSGRSKMELLRNKIVYGHHYIINDAWNIYMKGAEYMSRCTEDWVRFATFLTSRQMGRSMEQSIMDAKEVTVNFNRKGAGSKSAGKWDVSNFFSMDNVHFLSAYAASAFKNFYAFSNASIQGLDKNVRLHINHTAGMLAWDGAAVMLGMLSALCIPMMLSAIGGDPDDYWDMPDSMRRMGIMLPLGKDGTFLTLPMSIEHRAAYGIGELLGTVVCGNENLPASEITFQAFEQISQILPLDLTEGNGSMLSLVPTAVRPEVEIAFNKNWLGMPIYKEPFNKYTPAFKNVYQSTNPNYVAMSKWLNEVQGGGEYEREGMQVNPAMVQHLVESYTGGAGKFVSRTSGVIAKIIQGEQIRSNEIPFYRTLVKSVDDRTHNRAARERFQREYDKGQKLIYKIDNYQREAARGNSQYMKELDEFARSNDMLAYMLWKSYNSFKRQYNDAKSYIGDDKEKRAALDHAQMLVQKMMTECARAVEKAKTQEEADKEIGRIQSEYTPQIKESFSKVDE